MPRTRAFDPVAALESAQHQFWRRGYAATSMADLVAGTGVARAGLYAEFGSKRALYLAALEQYATDRDRSVVEQLARPGSPLANVRALLESYAETVVTDTQRKGCLVTNSAVELAEQDPAVATLVARSWRTLTRALTSALESAQRAGEVSEVSRPAALARMIVVFLQGLQVVGRTPAPARARARDEVATLLSLLSGRDRTGQ